jgi:hypothetical protein
VCASRGPLQSDPARAVPAEPLPKTGEDVGCLDMNIGKQH